LAETATAPRIRQYEQLQRRTVLDPSVSFTRKRTALQWHAPLSSPVCIADLMIVFTAPELFRAATLMQHLNVY
jgi:hypothetical protein